MEPPTLLYDTIRFPRRVAPAGQRHLSYAFSSSLTRIILGDPRDDELDLEDFLDAVQVGLA